MLPYLTIEATMYTWPPSSDGGDPCIRGLRRQTGGIHAYVASVVRRGGSAASTRTTPVLPDLTIEATQRQKSPRVTEGF